MTNVADAFESGRAGRSPPRAWAVAALLAVLLAAVVLPVRAVGEPSPAPSEPATVADTDAAALASLAVFLRDYRLALSTGDRRYLAGHTVLPLAVEELVYDMEVKVRRRLLATAADVLRAKDELIWPAEFAADSPQALLTWRRGDVDCLDPASPDRPDYRRGEAAIAFEDDEAQLTYLVAACDSQAHSARLSFVRSGDTWRLRERTVVVGGHPQ